MLVTKTLTGVFVRLCALSLIVFFGVSHAAQVFGEEPADKTFSVTQYLGKQKAFGKFDINVTKRPLRQILDFLEQKSGMNIRVKPQKIENDEITVKLSNVDWRTVLDVIAEEHRYTINDKHSKRKILYLAKLPTVELQFDNAPIEAVIKAITDQSDANIVIGPEVKGTVTAHLKDMPWKDALSTVLKSAGFVSVDEPNDTVRITTPENLVKTLETRIFKMSYIKPKGAAYRAQISTPYATRVEDARDAKSGSTAFSLIDVLTKLKSNDGVIAYERSSNSLIITDLPTKLDVIEKIIEKLDKPPKQVHITIRLVETDQNDTSSYGIEFGDSGLSGSITGAQVDNIFPFSSGSGPLSIFRSGWTPGVTGGSPLGTTSGPVRLHRAPVPTTVSSWEAHMKYGTLSFSDLSVALKLIKKSETTRILMAPQLTTLENEEATIHVGKNIRWAEYFTEVTEFGTVSGLREARRSPIQEVIPKIVDVSLDDFETFGSTTENIRLPLDTERLIVTKLLLRNGETAVIAGLVRQRYEDEEAKIPFLGDIPILGWLFSYRTVKEDRHKDMIMLVTVNVVDIEREAALRDEIEAERLKLLNKRKEIAQKIRVTFSKQGKLKFISHLDMARLFQRAAARAGLPVVFTEGFNPRPRIVFLDPLSLGVESEGELVEIELTRWENPARIVARLARELPEGIALHAGESIAPRKKATPLAAMTYAIDLAKCNLQVSREAVTAFCARARIPFERFSHKKGTQRTIDLRPAIQQLSLTDDNRLLLKLGCGGADKIKPEEVLSALTELEINREWLQAITRTEMIPAPHKKAMFE